MHRNEKKKIHHILHAAAAAKPLQSCATLCDPIDGSPPGSPVPGILQARTLKWVAISFSNAWKWKVKGQSLSRVQLLATAWTAAYQAPPSTGFSRQEYWSGGPLPSSPQRQVYSTCNPYRFSQSCRGFVSVQRHFHLTCWYFSKILYKLVWLSILKFQSNKLKAFNMLF